MSAGSASSRSITRPLERPRRDRAAFLEPNLHTVTKRCGREVESLLAADDARRGRSWPNRPSTSKPRQLDAIVCGVARR